MLCVLLRPGVVTGHAPGAIGKLDQWIRSEIIMSGPRMEPTCSYYQHFKPGSQHKVDISNV